MNTFPERRNFVFKTQFLGQPSALKGSEGHFSSSCQPDNLVCNGTEKIMCPLLPLHLPDHKS